MADFDLFKVKVFDRYISFLKKGLTLTKRRRMTYCASKSVQPFWLHPHQRANFKNLLEKVLTRRTRTRRRRRTWIVTLKTLTNHLVVAILALTVVSARYLAWDRWSHFSSSIFKCHQFYIICIIDKWARLAHDPQNVLLLTGCIVLSPYTCVFESRDLNILLAQTSNWSLLEGRDTNYFIPQTSVLVHFLLS